MAASRTISVLGLGRGGSGGVSWRDRSATVKVVGDNQRPLTHNYQCACDYQQTHRVHAHAPVQSRNGTSLLMCWEGERDAASLAADLWAVNGGASVLRVHQVSQTVDALKVWSVLGGDCEFQG